MFKPKIIYYEDKIKEYKLGKKLLDKYIDIPKVEIENHNNIEELRKKQNKEFVKLKQNLIIGIRKTQKFVVNHKTSDFLVPYTSSGCSAMCLYCYLVCNYNKCSYLRLFVNREELLEKIIRESIKSEKELTFEIGSNSDLILENTITNNLEWTIEEFGKRGKGFLTLPTKFDMVDSLLDLKHNGKTIVRMSMNPTTIIRKVELGTSNLERRVEAINKLKEAGYKVGILIAPVILIDDWKIQYEELFKYLYENLSNKVKKEAFFEIIFMTYSFVHRMINQEAFPNAIEIYEKDKMIGRGRGKYCYRKDLKLEAEEYIRTLIKKYFKTNEIVYIV